MRDTIEIQKHTQEGGREDKFGRVRPALVTEWFIVINGEFRGAERTRREALRVAQAILQNEQPEASYAARLRGLRKRSR